MPKETLDSNYSLYILMLSQPREEVWFSRPSHKLYMGMEAQPARVDIHTPFPRWHRGIWEKGYHRSDYFCSSLQHGHCHIIAVMRILINLVSDIWGPRCLTSRFAEMRLLSGHDTGNFLESSIYLRPVTLISLSRAMILLLFFKERIESFSADESFSEAPRLK